MTTAIPYNIVIHHMTNTACCYSPKDVGDDEYASFYRLFSKDSSDPLAKTHFTAEGEVTFKAILFVPPVSCTLSKYCCGKYPYRIG